MTAKRKKTLIIWAVVLAAVLIVGAVVYWNFPKMSDISESAVFDEALVSETAKEIITLYGDDEYEAVVEYMTDDMKSVLNVATLSISKAQLATADFGELLSFGQMYISEVKQGGELFAMVQVNVSYANTGIAYTLTFDEEMKLAGFYLK
ncbi:MAG: DUF3887 domain-containing protein [Lachnospiraceae bacterium]|nr:DUF3887 domain-containing protein [Lachnospiraceae bacterium]